MNELHLPFELLGVLAMYLWLSHLCIHEEDMMILEWFWF